MRDDYDGEDVVVMNRAHIGHEFAAPEPFEVTRGKIREFAELRDTANELVCTTVNVLMSIGTAAGERA